MPDRKEKIPFWGSWNAWYILVLGFLVLLIGFFYWVTKYFS